MARRRRAAIYAWLPIWLSACPNPNLYTTPRTLPPGTVQFQVAPEVIGVSYKEVQTNYLPNGTPAGTATASVAGISPMVPSFGVRIGATERVEVGVRLPNSDSLSLDVKWLLVKGPFDVAIDPGMQVYDLSQTGVVYPQLPVLLGINVSPWASFVLSPGVACSIVPGNTYGGEGITGTALASGFIGRFGVGLNLRASSAFSLEPEVTFLHQFSDADLWLWVIGIGLNFGAQPDYSDLGGSENAP